MKTIDYESTAKEITGQCGKYVGNSTVLLPDGSKIQIGNTVALLTRNINGIEETTVYHLVNEKWVFGSSSYVKHLENGEYEVFGALEKIMTFKKREKWNISTSNLRKMSEMADLKMVKSGNLRYLACYRKSNEKIIRRTKGSVIDPFLCKKEGIFISSQA